MIETHKYTAQLNALKSEYVHIPKLRFSNTHETQFQKNRRESFLELDHALLLFGAIVYLAFIFSDMAVLPAEYIAFVATGRVIISLVMFTSYYMVKHAKHPWFQRYIFELIAFILFIVAAHVSITSYFLPQPYHMIFMLGIVQIYIVAPALLKPDSKLCMLTLVSMLALTAIVLFLADKPDISTNSLDINEIFNQFPLIYTSFLAGLVVVSGYLAYTFEKMLRKNWLDNEITELKSTHLETVSKQLLTLSHEDPLTQLANRRYFQEMLTTELQRALRSKEPLSLLMLDLDQFKSFNDAYGHQAGDDCLKRISHCLKDQCSRSTDLPARYGGEEFVVLLPNTDADGALFIANNIRHAIEKLRITHEASSFGVVTISIGVTTLDAGKTATIDTLIQRADQALYTAKNNGRNQTEMYTPEEPEPELPDELSM